MRDVATVQLGEVCDIVMGQAPDGGSYNDQGLGFPLIAGAGDFGSSGRPETKRHTSEPTKISRPGDIVLSIRATIGTKVLSDRAYCLGRGVAGLRAKLKLDGRYLWHWLTYAEPILHSKGKGATFPQVSRSDISELLIPLPPLDEQRRIAAILDKADALRRKRQHALDLLNGLTQSIFLEMFGDTDHNHRTYPVVEIGAIMAEGPSNGLYKPSSAYGGGTPILRINNFYSGEVTSLEDLRRLTLDDSEIARFELKEEDIVINRVNSREYVGKSAIVPPLKERTVYESNIMRFRVQEKKALPAFVIQALQTSAVQRQIQSKIKDAINQSSINQKDVRSFRIVLAPIVEQRRFAQAVQSLVSTRSVQRAEARRAQALFASLQHRAFTGQL